MKTYKFFWDAHKWTGIIGALVFSMIAVTGFMLLLKKEYSWIQPPTQEGAEGEVAEFLSPDDIFRSVFAANHADFQSMEDVNRVDFRPSKRVHKVQSVHNHTEVQVCAVTGEILSVDSRMSDLLETIHDGSFFADGIHEYFMPLVAVALLFLVFSGLFLWLQPVLKRRKRKTARARTSSAP